MTNKRTKKGYNLSIHDIATCFDLPLHDAAKTLGVSETYLKRRCRASGIVAWPFRQIRRLKNRIKSLHEELDSMTDERERQTLIMKINLLKDELKLIHRKPSIAMNLSKPAYKKTGYFEFKLQGIQKKQDVIINANSLHKCAIANLINNDSEGHSLF